MFGALVRGAIMAGYSKTPLSQKLGIKPHHRVIMLGAPDGFRDALEPLPQYVTLATQLRRTSNVIIYFATRAVDLRRRFRAMVAKLDARGGLWIAWPKRASKVPTDLTEDVVRDIALDAGLVDNKVCAIDSVWSGLRLVVRMADRPGWRRGR
jgi:hypothetical protein